MILRRMRRIIFCPTPGCSRVSVPGSLRTTVRAHGQPELRHRLSWVKKPQRRTTRDTDGCLSQPVAGGEAAVGVAGTGVGGAGAVAGHHRPRPPPGQAHQVHFGAALGKPLGGRRHGGTVGGCAKWRQEPPVSSLPTTPQGRPAGGRLRRPSSASNPTWLMLLGSRFLRRSPSETPMVKRARSRRGSRSGA